MNTLEEMRARRRARYFGKRFWKQCGADGRVEIGVIKGHDGLWMVGYITESCAVRRISNRWLEPTTYPAELQQQFESWAVLRGFEEVR